MGYYTLLSRSIERQDLPQSNRFPREGVGVVLLGHLAVDKSAQGQRIGTLMLIKAIEQTEQAAQNIGIFALAVHALTDEARQWYLNFGFGFGFGFEELSTDPRHLYLSIDTIRMSGIVGEGL